MEFLELKAKFVKPMRHGDISFSAEVGQLLSEGNKNILLIDDCIDTGYTIKMIKDYIVGSEDLLLFPIDNGHYDTTPYIADELTK